MFSGHLPAKGTMKTSGNWMIVLGTSSHRINHIFNLRKSSNITEFIFQSSFIDYSKYQVYRLKIDYEKGRHIDKFLPHLYWLNWRNDGYSLCHCAQNWKKSSLTDEYIFVKTIVYTPISITINGFHKNNC